ncbi:hypothetical protein VNO77_26008 [Canavalia gladiata]|uniref:Disease resistance N-terminal domain-containing protein n=1 Tax=Canavalia gladiata TaxID=3824 RepID=A0AAN9KSH4_CANGL
MAFDYFIQNSWGCDYCECLVQMREFSHLSEIDTISISLFHFKVSSSKKKVRPTMAAELVGGAFLSAFVQTLFSRLATREVADFIRGVKNDDCPNQLDKLKITLRSVDALVNHAEERQSTDLHMREWLNDLKDVMFEAEDLLDVISVSTSSKVCISSSASLGGFGERMKTIIEKFEDLLKQKDVLCLREGLIETTSNKKLQTTSLAGKSSIYGRDADKDNIIKILLKMSDYGSDKICVLPIVAEFVSGEFSFRLEGEKNDQLSKRTRHLSYSKLQLDDLEKIMATCEKLRTFLPSQLLSWPRCLNNEAVGSLISKHTSLRVLSLSHCALSLVGFSSVIYVDDMFYNNSSMEVKQTQGQDITPFRCLEILRFENMPQWQEWLPFGEEDEEGAFPCLKQLYIKNCPKLKGTNLIQKLPSLEKIVITKCEQFVVTVLPTIRELELECCEKVSIQEPLLQLMDLTIRSYNATESLFEGIDNKNSSIEKLSISSCPLILQVPSNGIADTLKSLNVTNCEKIEFPMNQCFAYLESLCIKRSCNSLRSFTMDLFPKMVHLEIQGCQSLESLVVSGACVEHLQSLNSLKIWECPNFVSFPEGGLAAPNLTNLQLHKCKNLKSLPCQMNKLLPSLMTLNIKECPELDSFSEGGSCQDGESFPERWLLPSTLTSFHILALWDLKYLDEDSLQKLTSLETLGIACCPKLQCMPAKLPSSISTLHIMKSPRLEERCKGKKAEDWPKIAHISMIRINKKLLQ